MADAGPGSMAFLHLVGDARGGSHVVDAPVPLRPVGFAPPAPAMPVADVEPATGVFFLVLPAGSTHRKLHAAPALCRRAGHHEVPASPDFPGIVAGVDICMEMIPDPGAAKESRLA